MKKLKEIKRIDTDKLRQTCINNNWYTKGNTEDYKNMFRICECDTVSLELLYEIAENIYNHTNIASAREGCDFGYTDEENILNMMIYINNCCYVYYKIEDA